MRVIPIFKNRAGQIGSKVLFISLALILLSINFTQLVEATSYPQASSIYTSSYGFYTQTTKQWANKWVDVTQYQSAFATEMTLAKQYAPLLKVDPVMVVWWTYVETGEPNAKYDSYHYSYCPGDGTAVKYNIDRNCGNPDWGGWQLGYGEQFTDIRQAGLLATAFQATYGDPNDTSLVARVGQNALSKSGISKTFPKQTIAQLIKNTSTTQKVDGNYWTYTLMRDPRISVYMVAQEIAWDMGNGKDIGENYRQVAASWGSYYSQNWQNFSNVLWDTIALWKLIDAGKQP